VRWTPSSTHSARVWASTADSLKSLSEAGDCKSRAKRARGTDGLTEYLEFQVIV
jgi:hypothetical protein